MVAVRWIGLAVLVAAPATGSEARVVHAASALRGTAGVATGEHADLLFRVTADDDVADGNRWMLDPPDGEYEQADRSGFRLRLRGAKVKMRMPLDLR